MLGSRNLAGYTPAVLVFIVLVAAWEILAPVLGIPEIILPVPTHIGAALLDPGVNWPRHIGITAFEIAAGFASAVVFGIAIAVGIVISPWLRRLLMPYVLLAQIIPKIAFAPIFFLVLGYNLVPTIFITFLVAFFPMIVDTAAGLSSLDPRMEDLLRSLQASRWDILRKARFPKSLPFIFSGLKVSSTLAVIGASVAEFISAKAGLGFLIINAQVTFNASLAFAAAIYLILLGIVFYAAIDVAQRLAMPWDKGTRIS